MGMGGLSIRWNGESGLDSEGSLFAVFAALARGEADGFPALRPHQREPWHAFCVQVAAMALIRAGERELPVTEEDWRRLLIGLTPDWPDGEAWSLVVEDWTKPALLQPPVVRLTDAKDYKNRLTTPDALDMLVTSKNHDVKQRRMVHAREEDWLFALVTLQTSTAYGGAKTYGSSRMNGKTGSRLAMRVRPAGGASRSFRRDVSLLIDADDIESEKLGLLWLDPWDGEISLSFGELNRPLYVDCSRRIRLVQHADGMFAEYATSSQARVESSAQNGKTHDPWAPIKADLTASVTPKRDTFGYRKTSDLLASPKPYLGNLYASDDAIGLSIELAALVRRGGTDTNTDGLFRRQVFISRQIQKHQRSSEFLDLTGRIAKRRSDEVGKTTWALRRALFMLFQGAPVKRRGDGTFEDITRFDDDATGKKVMPWTGRFDVEVDRIFFDDPFWAEIGEEEGQHRQPWRKKLREIAREVFDEAAESAPRTDVRRVRARVRARGFLDAQLYRFVEEMDGE